MTYSQLLAKIIAEIPKNEVIQWANNTNINYYNFNDLELYLDYLKSNQHADKIIDLELYSSLLNNIILITDNLALLTEAYTELKNKLGDLYGNRTTS